MLLDPTISLTLRAVFALIFAAALTHKLSNAAQFRQTLVSYLRGFGIDAHGAEKPLRAMLIVLEIGVVAACALPAAQSAAGLLAGGLLLLYAFAMTVNLIRETCCSIAAAPGDLRARACARHSSSEMGCSR